MSVVEGISSGAHGSLQLMCEFLLILALLLRLLVRAPSQHTDLLPLGAVCSQEKNRTVLTSMWVVSHEYQTIKSIIYPFSCSAQLLSYFGHNFSSSHIDDARNKDMN